MGFLGNGKIRAIFVRALCRLFDVHPGDRSQKERWRGSGVDAQNAAAVFESGVLCRWLWSFWHQKSKDVQTVDKTVENLLIIGENNSQSIGTEQFLAVDNFDAVDGSL